MELTAFFRQYPKAALAFSGGVDSAYLLYAAVQNGADIRPYYVKSAFQPQFELNDAQKLAAELHLTLQILPIDILAEERVNANPPDRCYYCKRRIFKTIIEQAKTDGYSILLDGTNASDDTADRPGIRALQELEVLSPLRLCGLTKDKIRQLSREAGLFTWEKPAYACLATRIPAGETITAESLSRTEQAESFLFSLGFRDFRVRQTGDAAKLQIKAAQWEQAAQQRGVIAQKLRQWYTSVLLDLEERP